jgi:hypothetical protein
VGTPDPSPMPDRVHLSEVVHQSPDKIELRKALFSPFQAGGFPVHLSAFYSASNVKDPKTGRRHALLSASLAIDAHGLKSTDTRKGESNWISSSSKIFQDALTPEEMNRLVASGLVCNLEVEIPDAGPYQLRIAAWDASRQ